MAFNVFKDSCLQMLSTAVEKVGGEARVTEGEGEKGDTCRLEDR